MAPPSAATAAPARRQSGGHSPARRWGRGAGTASPGTRRPPLRVVPGRTKQRTGAGAGAGRTRSAAGRGRGRTLHVVSVSLVVSALLAVVVAQAMLANGQVRLSGLEHQLSLEQGAHRQAELAVSGLETPSRIVAAAAGQLHMVRTNIVELPYVSLSTPLATPKVTAAPPPPPPPTKSTNPASGSGSGSGSSTGSSGSGTAGTASTGASTASSTPGTATTTATSIP